MAAEEEVVVLVRLAGTRAFIANSQAAGLSVKQLGLETEAAGLAMDRTTRRSYIMNQALFTMRRLLYGVTLATIGAGIYALKMGQDYNTAIQNAQVALGPFFDSQQAMNDAIQRLWYLAAYTPFRIADMTKAFSALYPPMSQIGFTADQIIDAIGALINGLSVAQKVTPAALNRISIALQHLAFSGRLTGIAVTQLARDGLPIYEILNKELGVTADQMHRIGELNIPANVALQAITHYLNTQQGYAGAALRLSQQTFQGVWSTFQDYVGRMSGSLEHHLFNRLQGRLTNINNYFQRLFQQIDSQGGTISTSQIVASIDPRLVPIWRLLASDVRLFFQNLGMLFKLIASNKLVWAIIVTALYALHAVLAVINNVLHDAAPLLYILISAWLVYKTTIIVATAVTKTNVFWTTVQTAKVKDLTFAQWLATIMTGRWIKAIAALTVVTKAQIFFTRIWSLLLYGSVMGPGGFQKMTNFEKRLRAIRLWILANYQATKLWAAAQLALMAEFLVSPVGIVLAVTAIIALLVVLYFKWKAFHDIVNNTFNFIRENWRYIELALSNMFAPLIIAAEALKYLIEHWHQISRGAKKQGKSILDVFSGGTLIPPGFAGGGIMPYSGLAWVGERGPELVSLPAGARVYSNDTLRSGMADAWMSSQQKQPVVIELKLDRRVLERVMVDIQSDRDARS